MSGHTPTPWFVSGVRFRMNGGEWHSIDRFDATLKQDENIACVGYDPLSGIGLSDAHFIVKAVNSHEALVDALEFIRDGYANQDVNHVDYRVKVYEVALDALSRVGLQREPQP
jgi:hypothetical protein